MKFLALLALATVTFSAENPAVISDLIPPPEFIQRDHPRVLLRPAGTDLAITLTQIRNLPRDPEAVQMLAQLRGQRSAAAQAMVWLLTGEKEAAATAVARMRNIKIPASVDSFSVYFGLREMALAYDWLYDYEGFTPEIKTEVRQHVTPLVTAGLRLSDDHLFHNYVWQCAGGLTLWAMATVGEDEACDRVYAAIRERLNTRLLPGLEYLDGAPGESMWYWALYDFSPAALALLATQSASGRDLMNQIRTRHGDYLARQFEHVSACTFPNMSYTPFGDTKMGATESAAGPDGGVTHEMAGVLAGLTWALKSETGAWFDNWLAKKRGLSRYYGETGVFYFLYGRQLTTVPAMPPLAFLAGNRQGGHALARSGWDDGATIAALRITDHFGSHNHFDQGSFIVFRNGMLAMDQLAYKKVGEPQQLTAHHNTLLINGQGQRKTVGQNFRTMAEFQANLSGGVRLETGNMLFYHNTPAWMAAAGQFAQAYPEGVVDSCVRQMLYIRPGTVVVVDQLAATSGHLLEEVRWLLHVPAGAIFNNDALVATNSQSFLRCRQLLPGNAIPEKSTTLMPACERYAFMARGKTALQLVHVLEIGDGAPPVTPLPATALTNGNGVTVQLGEQAYLFNGAPTFKVEIAPTIR